MSGVARMVTSNMTLMSKGVKKSTAQRPRMPWVVATEVTPTHVLRIKDKSILDGTVLVENMERSAQVDPIDVLKRIAAQHDYDVSTGRNLFQLAAHLPYFGRGQRFYRKEWMEGTCEKYITLTAIEFAREGFNGDVMGYMTFHGETTLCPMKIPHCDVPGWVVDYVREKEVPFGQMVPAPPSVGVEAPVDPSTYRLRSYPGYDPPNDPKFVERFLQEKGVLPTLTEEGKKFEDEEQPLAERETIEGDGDESVPFEHKPLDPPYSWRSWHQNRF